MSDQDPENCPCPCFVTMDSTTPYRVQLSAYFKRSFAHYTVKERMPVILTKCIDGFVRDKEDIIQIHGEDAREEIKAVIGEFSKLKYEIQTNKPIAKLISKEPDAKVYNRYLVDETSINGVPKYFNAVWLYSECYMYRRIRNIFENTTSLQNFDPFLKQKQNSFWTSLNAIAALAAYVIPVVMFPAKFNSKYELKQLLKLNLWGNRCDLSLTVGENVAQIGDPLKLIDTYDSYILSDASESIWVALDKKCKCDDIEFINDNAGYEMFTDFCLADFLISYNITKHITFNIKAIPWFISDTTEPDIKWILNVLINHEDTFLKKCGIRWKKYFRDGTWTMEADPFWTMPFDYTRMESQAPALYARLAKSKLLIFKGDLNYRKLFGEKKWEPTTPVEEGLQGFIPTRLCALRTVKSDMVVGLEQGVADKLDEDVPDWMTTGHYGVIQFVG